MAYKTPKKVTPRQVLTFIMQYHKRYGQLPAAGVIASFYKVSHQTIYTRLDELEAEKKLKRIMVRKHATTYKLK